MFHKAHDFVGEEASEFVFGVQDLLVQALSVGVFKGQVSANHGVEDNSSTPEVSFLTIILKAFDQFRRSIAWRSASSGKLLILSVRVAQPEVDHL